MPSAIVPLWVHGHTMNIENPDRIRSFSRTGPFGRILGKSAENTWVHFSVPAPYTVDGRSLPLESVAVRFRTTPSDAWIEGVHVFDGESRILTLDGLHNAPGSWTVSLFTLPTARVVQRAVGISIHVRFHLDSGVSTNQWRIDFSSVGCYFVRST